MNILLHPLDIIIDHPCLKIRSERGEIIYEGPIIVNADMYHIKIREIHYENTIKFQFSDVDNSLKNYPGILEDINRIDSVNISSYMKSLVQIIDRYNPPLQNDSAICMKVLTEYKEFSEFYIDLKSLELTPDLSSITVSFSDQNNREHHVEFGVDKNKITDIFHFKSYDVPLDKRNTLEKVSSNLKELYNIFLEYIGCLQPFFEFMDMVDAHCVVIDPKEISRKYTYRRVLLEKNFSVIITVDPFNMSSCPNFAFVGPNNLVCEYQRRVQKNIINWNYKGYAFEEVLLVLGIEKFSKEAELTQMPQNQNDELLRADTDCSICYSFELNGNIPDIACDNHCCGNIYHKECLYEWLTSIESRKNFSEIEGSCPNCDKSITCPILDI